MEVRPDVCQRLNCFPPRMRAMFAELKRPISPSISPPRCPTWDEKNKKNPLKWWSSGNQMYCPLFFAPPLEIIPVYFGSSSEKLPPTFTRGPARFCGNNMQIFCCLWIQDEFPERKRAFSLHLPLVISPLSGLLHFGVMPTSFEH